MILRNLIRIGPQRFQDFLETPEGISPTTLSNRLKALQKHGLIARIVTEDHPPRTRYELTEFGRLAQPMMREIRTCGQKLQARSEKRGVIAPDG